MTAPRPRLIHEDPLLTPQQVCEQVPGLTLRRLERLRNDGQNNGPSFIKLTPRTIVYPQSAIDSWVARAARN